MKHELKNIIIIGELDFGKNELIIDEAQVDTSRIHFGKGLGECKICVYADEGTIPHFHIMKNKNEQYTCICLFEPLYFHHGNKNGTLNSKQKRILNDWLLAPINYNGINLTRWETAVFLWRMNNGEKYIPQHSLKQPDYTTMVNYKEDRKY